MRYAAIFGLFGYTVVLALSLFGETPFLDVMRTALIWGAAFAAIGWAVGRAVGVLVGEVDLAEEPMWSEAQQDGAETGGQKVADAGGAEDGESEGEPAARAGRIPSGEEERIAGESGRRDGPPGSLDR
ncbi:MAG: hypothetical protein ACE5GW_14340 [Planctomycetota bacterium]